MELYRKLVKARASKAVVCSTPTGVKSFQLKFMEILHKLDEFKALSLPPSRAVAPHRTITVSVCLVAG